MNTGAFDPLPAIVRAVRANGGWLHVDGAFGLWAGADPARRHLVEGVGEADSWTTDAHKWLNVPYDSGLSFTAHPAAHQAAMTLGAAYYVETTGGERDPYNWVPESSRRARGFTIWAALRSLGRDGVADLVARTSDLARRFAAGLEGAPGVRILNDVVLNQVLVRFEDPSGDLAAGDATDRRRHRGRPGRRHALAGRHPLARAARDADLRLGLEHDGGGRGRVDRGDPAHGGGDPRGLISGRGPRARTATSLPHAARASHGAAPRRPAVAGVGPPTPGPPGATTLCCNGLHV